jgi:putative FmdB family regulatory protein
VPTYQYTCTECGHDLEVVQKFTDEPLVECPQCTGKLRKVFSAVGVVFKGSGFYRTDSRQKSSSATPSASGTDGKAADNKAADNKAKANSEHASPVGKDSSSSSSASSSSSSGSSSSKGAA